ncbi:hypothetical protein I350_04306 [Cryptococcus amylolentus CBS 6273]|uniref:non-specific serine/threonine protein kinase n=1 Tax=Cryptococcus amylolentus CBS 6273 TaxID=1296118 RepID=A0A1E3K1N8_9TREE|nr:hypothetical protein I350_04306 [Cryptococcus amylolentus CBS 6273]
MAATLHHSPRSPVFASTFHQSVDPTQPTAVFDRQNSQPPLSVQIPGRSMTSTSQGAHSSRAPSFAEDPERTSSRTQSRNVSSSSKRLANTSEASSKSNRYVATLQDFQLIRVLGKGCAGRVLLVKHTATNHIHAMKAISKRSVLTHDELGHTLTEVSILRRMTTEEPHNRFVSRLHYSFTDRENFYFVMEFYPGGDMATQMEIYGILGDHRTRFYAADITQGLEDLHRHGIIVRDLKPENILLNAKGHAVLADFGLSKEFPYRGEPKAVHVVTYPGQSALPIWAGKGAGSLRELLSGGTKLVVDKAYSFVGTSEYLSPEVVKRGDYSYAVDWWALGCIVLEGLIGRVPFRRAEDDPPMVLWHKILYEPWEDCFRDPKLARHAPDQVTYNFIDAANPMRRLTEPYIKEHDYFSMIDWGTVQRGEYQDPHGLHIHPTAEYNTRYFPKLCLQEDPTVDMSTHDLRDYEAGGGKKTPMNDEVLFKLEQAKYRKELEGFTWSREWEWDGVESEVTGYEDDSILERTSAGEGSSVAYGDEGSVQEEVPDALPETLPVPATISPDTTPLPPALPLPQTPEAPLELKEDPAQGEVLPLPTPVAEVSINIPPPPDVSDEEVLDRVVPGPPDAVEEEIPEHPIQNAAPDKDVVAEDTLETPPSETTTPDMPTPDAQPADESSAAATILETPSSPAVPLSTTPPPLQEVEEHIPPIPAPIPKKAPSSILLPQSPQSKAVRIPSPASVQLPSPTCERILNLPTDLPYSGLSTSDVISVHSHTRGGGQHASPRLLRRHLRQDSEETIPLARLSVELHGTVTQLEEEEWEELGMDVDREGMMMIPTAPNGAGATGGGPPSSFFKTIRASALRRKPSLVSSSLKRQYGRGESDVSSRGSSASPTKSDGSRGLFSGKSGMESTKRAFKGSKIFPRLKGLGMGTPMTSPPSSFHAPMSDASLSSPEKEKSGSRVRVPPRPGNRRSHTESGWLDRHLKRSKPSAAARQTQKQAYSVPQSPTKFGIENANGTRQRVSIVEHEGVAPRLELEKSEPVQWGFNL